MKLPAPLARATLVRRYKRFLADCLLENSGEEITAHVANPGAMEGLDMPGLRIWLSKSDNPRRKLQWSWELAEVEQFGRKALVGINTILPNRLAFEAISNGHIPELAGYAAMRKEVRYGEKSRVDLLLENHARLPDCYVEVKNVHLLRRKGLAEFPDTATRRGARHLEELTDMVRAGKRAVMLYIVQRDDAEKFAVAADKDPLYARNFVAAQQAGVEMISYDCRMSTTEILVGKRLKMIFPDDS